jgi:tryptophan halogenase
MNDGTIRSIVVAGDGVVALSAAAAFARALPQAKVRLIQTASTPAAVTDLLPGSQPSIARFHALIGLDEAAVIGAGAATWRIATRYRQWSASGSDWYHFAGDCGPPIGSIDFHHLWSRAHREDRARPYHEYAAGGVLAAAGKFVMPADDPTSPFSRFDYALRLVPVRYRALLERHCDSLGVQRSTGRIAKVVTAGDAVETLQLEDGRSVTGELYIDCVGPSAPLRSSLGGEMEDWSSVLPVCRIFLEDDVGEPAAVDTFTRTSAGWEWHSPGASQGRVVDADEPGDGSILVTPRHFIAPWRSNVLAIGDAATAIDPLGWYGLCLAHRSIARALELLPDRNFRAVELGEYNRRTAQDAALLRDLTALYFWCPNAPDSPFWRRMRALQPTETLHRTIELFARRGRLPTRDEDIFGPGHWVAALIGLGVTPKDTDPVAAAIDRGVASDAMARWAGGLGAVVRGLPSYHDYLDNTLQHLAPTRN